MDTYIKRPSEKYGIAIEFASKLPAAAALTAGTVAAVERTTGIDATGTILTSPTATINGTTASFIGQAGSDETDYLITMTVTLSDGSILVEEVLLQVRKSMAMIADAGAIDANTYCTREEGDRYHRTHLYNTVWTLADDWRRDAALIWATRLLDEQASWLGTKASSTQALRWPRTDVMDADGDEFPSDAIPTWLKNATAELARYLLTEDRTEERSYGLKSVKADVVEVEFDSADEKPVIPTSVRSMISAYGSLLGSSQGWIKLERV